MKTTHHSRPVPSRLLSSLLLRTGVLLFTSLGVSGVFAASTEIDTAGTSATVIGHKTALPGGPNSGPISATIDNATGNVITVGPTINTTISNSGALIAAKATGTTYSNAIDLSLIAAGPPDGAASLLSGVNTGQINAAVSNSSTNVSASGFVSGVLTNNSNSITAAATLNAGSTLISGSLPVAGYTSATDGSADLRSAPTGVSPRVAAAGSIVASTYQDALNAGPQNGSGAVLNNNKVTLAATSTTPGNIVSASPELNDNTLAAAYKGNTAATAIAIASGGGVGMTGSAVVTNLQANVTTNGVVASPATAAGNTNSLVSLSVDSSGASTNTNTLTGTASLLRSAISASATGNEATGNRIDLADTVGFTGASAASPDSGSDFGSGTTASSRAALVVANVQTNTGAPLPGNDFSTQLLASTTSNGDVRASVQNLVGGALNVNDSSVTASATGNAAVGVISAAGNRAALDASSALTSVQVNTLAPVQSSNMNSDIVATIGTGLTNSPVNVNGSLQQASATGNQGAQTLSLSATDLHVKGTAGSLDTGVHSNYIHLDAFNVGALVTSAQTSVQSSTTALTSAANVLLDASHTTANVTGSALSATGGTQDAIALGGSAANNLTLSATTLSGNAGLVNAQGTDASSPTSANVSASSVQLLAGNSGANVVGSPLTVSGNLQRAIAYGATASNTVNIGANTANVPASGGTASNVSLNLFGHPYVEAQYGLLNDQSTQSSVTAGVNASATPSFGISVGANLDGTSATNDGNAVLAVGYGNQAANGMTLAVNTLVVPTPGYANVASVTNAQKVGDDANVSASSVSGAALVRTTVAGGVTQASVTASGNEVQTLAYGNRANSNTLAVTATSLSSVKTTGSVLTGSLNSGNATADAALTVQNAQYGGTGAVSATQTYGAGAPAVLINAGPTVGGVSRSSLAADGNAFTASAYSNSATNGLSIEGGGIAASGGVQNMQAGAKTVTATIGTAGTPGTPLIPGAPYSFNSNATTSAPTFATGAQPPSIGLGGSTGAYTLTGWLRTTDSAAALDLWQLEGGYYYKYVTAYPIGATSSVANGDMVSWAGTTAGTPAVAGTRNSGGVLISARGAVTNSDLSVSGSVANATAVGNSSSNSLDLTKGTTVTANGIPTASSSVSANSSLSSAADYNVSNAQLQIGSATATAIGSYGIDDGFVPNTGTLAITGSTLKVDGNQQQATAQGNTGSNRLTLEANTLTGVSATTNNLSGAINSLQNSSAAVAATSNAEYFAPAVSTNSQLSISGNRNVALGNSNAVVNTLSATGNSVAPTNATSTDALLALTSGTSATGAWVLNNVQDSAGSTLGSTALSQIYNEDRGATSSTGLMRSTLNIDGNVNLSEATVNRATNTFTVLANQTGTTAGLANSQTSSTAVTSTANSLVGVTLAGSVTDAVINAGTVTLDNNITSALAKGNSATNVLNYGATAGYTNLGTTGTSTQNSVSNVQNASAVAALGNSQVNSGNVVASANNTTYAVALNSLGGGSVLGGNVSVANNYVAATGYGNEAINQLSVSALNSGTPTAALANYQRNSGAVTVTASNVTFNVLATGGALTGSTVRTMGNQITATATGNSAVSSILAR